MSKLFNFKAWLTLSETADRLTNTLGEKVSKADCLQLAIDGHITISALFGESRYVIAAKVITNSDRKVFEPWIVETTDEGAIIRTPAGDVFYSKTQLDYEYEDVKRVSNVFRIEDGIYDLPMIGAEKLDVMHHFDLEQSLKLREFVNLEGPFLITKFGLVNVLNTFGKFTIKSDESGKPKEYDEKQNAFVDYTLENYHSFFYPADGLGDVDFVFRRENIEVFEQKVLDNDGSKFRLDECLLIMGAMINSIKNSQITSKRWTQESLKIEMLEKDNRFSARMLDDYFSIANKSFKSKD